jgi:hypothetical protein
MKAVIETATGKASYLFGDAENVQITADMMVAPVAALDIKSGTHEVVSIGAPAKWVPGGVMSVVNGDWVINDQTAYDAFEVPVEPTVYKVITPTRYLALVKMASQMTNAEFAAYDTDPHADMVYTRAMLASISGMIDINIPDNMALVMEGLGYMAAHGHTGQIAPVDFPGAILAAWAGL